MYSLSCVRIVFLFCLATQHDAHPRRRAPHHKEPRRATPHPPPCTRQVILRVRNLSDSARDLVIMFTEDPSGGFRRGGGGGRQELSLEGSAVRTGGRGRSSGGGAASIGSDFGVDDDGGAVKDISPSVSWGGMAGMFEYRHHGAPLRVVFVFCCCGGGSVIVPTYGRGFKLSQGQRTENTWW